MRDHKPRAQKSQEYKQVVGLLVLVLAVAAVSFSLGVAVGKRSAPALADTGDEGERKQVAVAEKTSQVAASPEDAPKVNLTFYDTLPKGEETPLGSGINAPPEERESTASVSEDSPPEKPPATEPAKATPKTAPSESSKPKPPPVTAGEYVVQVASFKSDPDAKTLQQRLLGKGHRAFLQRVDLGEKGVWTRVYVGFFDTKTAAQRVADRLVSEDKLSPMVRRRQ